MNQVRYFCDPVVSEDGEEEEEPLLGRGEGRLVFLCQEHMLEIRHAIKTSILFEHKVHPCTSFGLALSMYPRKLI